jgi:hypothetical protein
MVSERRLMSGCAIASGYTAWGLPVPPEGSP